MWETTVQPWFVPCRNVTGFAVTLVVTYSEMDSVKFIDASVKEYFAGAGDPNSYNKTV